MRMQCIRSLTSSSELMNGASSRVRLPKTTVVVSSNAPFVTNSLVREMHRRRNLALVT